MLNLATVTRAELLAVFKTDKLARLVEDMLRAITVTLPGAADGVQANLDAHISDTADAHQASAIGFTPAGGMVSNTVQAGLLELNANKLATSVLDTDGTLAANSDAKIPSQKAVKTYADALIAAADAMVFKGVIDCSASPNYPAADRGHTYRVSVAGKIGGASGVNVEAGDILICLTDATPSGNQATVGASWTIVQANIDGAVIGPAVVVADNIASFNGTTGKIIKDSGKALPAGSIVGTTDAQTLSGKTLATPVLTGTAYAEQGAQTTKAGVATLTIAELLTGIIEYTGAAAALTLPTGANIDAGVLAGLANDRAFDFVIVNTGSGTATVTTNTGLTLTGAMTVASGVSAQFRVRKTAASTFTVYRIA